jgi:anti-sigma-K factor RskA
MDHETIAGWIPAYALGATDPDESQAVEAHLPGCAACRELLAEYRRLGEDLLYAVPPRAVPAGAAERFRRRLEPSRPAERPPSLWARLRARPAAIALVAALVLLGVTNLYWAGRVNGLQSQANDQAAFLARLTDAPAVRLTGDSSARYAQGVVYRPVDSPLALLCVYGMPALPADKTYQLWLIQDGRRDSGGLFRVTPEGFGLMVIHPERPLSDYSAVGITVEPAGGSLGPTSPRVLGADL